MLKLILLGTLWMIVYGGRFGQDINSGENGDLKCSAAYFLYVSMQGHCLSGWTYFSHTGRCYKLISKKASWGAARNMCRRGGAELASSPDEETNNFLSSFHRCGQLYNTELNPLTHTHKTHFTFSHQL